MYMQALVHVLMKLKSCTFGMRNAILRNHLKTLVEDNSPSNGTNLSL